MIIENLTQVKEAISVSMDKRSSALSSDAVELIAVTKNHAVDAMREAIDAGVTSIGENRVQEAKRKAAQLNRKAQWHLIGHLQTNKVKQAVRLFDLIHSVDSGKLAAEIDRAAKEAGKVQDILLQVNIAREESKFGISREETMPLAEEIGSLAHVRLRGLMMIAPHCDDAEMTRPLFREMYALFMKLQEMHTRRSDIQYLSMGMSNDYRIAIEEGANMVRIGTGIFGQRSY